MTLAGATIPSATSSPATIPAIENASAISESVVFATCECCKLTEECTLSYVANVRERYGGHWVCGLCGEAVKDEMSRAGRRISTEEAVRRHASFSERIRSPVEATEHLISAMLQLVRRGLDSPRASVSMPNSPLSGSGRGGAAEVVRRTFVRSESCFSTFGGESKV